MKYPEVTGGDASPRRRLQLSAAGFVSGSLALMATYVLWLYVRQEDLPVRPAALGFAAVAYGVAAFGMRVLAGGSGGGDAVDGPVGLGLTWRGARLRRVDSVGPRLARAARAALARVEASAALRPLGAACILVSLFLSVTLALAVWARGDAADRYWDLLVLWFVGMGLYVAPFALGRLQSREGPRTRAEGSRWRPTQPARDFALLTLGALALRVPALDSWPDILGGDEGLAGGIAQGMLHHLGNPFATMFAYGNLYHLLLAVFVGLLGSTAAALRLPNALAGGLAVGLTYLAGRELFDRRVGLISAALLATAHMHVHMSRTAHGQAIDSLLAALVVYSLARGLRRGQPGWMAVAGVGLGLAQHFYVGGRAVDVVVLCFVLLLAVVDRPRLRESWPGLAVAFGGALVTAMPMVVWALRRPADYLTRLNATGFVQTGGLADRVAAGTPAATALLGQMARAAVVPLAYPAAAFYSANIPMLDLLTGSLLVLGVAWGLAHVRDWRFLLLVCGLFVALLVLTLGNLVTVAAYRITGAMPYMMILAACGVVAVVSRPLAALGLSRDAADLALVGIVALVAGYNAGYTFLVQLPTCNYLHEDMATAAVSMSSRQVMAGGPPMTVLALTQPDFDFGAYPNGSYYLGRGTRPLAEALAAYGAPARDAFAWSVPPTQDVDVLGRFVESSPRPVAVIASPSRLADLALLAARFPGGEQTALRRCGGRVIASTYVVR